MSIKDRRLGREIAVVLAVKLAALALIWCLFFGPDQRVAVDADTVSHQLLKPPVSESQSVAR